MASSLVTAGGGLASADDTAFDTTVTPQQQSSADDPQGGPTDERPDFMGDYTTKGLGATAGPDDPESKTEVLGPIGSSDHHTSDVPGSTAAASTEADTTDDPQPTVPTERLGASDAELQAAVADGATTRVIVMTKTPIGLEGEMSAAAVDTQRAAIDGDLAALQISLRGTGSKRVSQLGIIPAATYAVNQAGMDALLANPNVASISLDLQVEAQLDTSTGVIDSDLLNQAGVLGDGFDGSAVDRFDVAVIDSGVDNQHNAFTGRIVAEACFVDDSSCPNGGNAQIGAGTADECTHSTDCDHGTHVGGIAAGAVYDDEHEGVASRSGIVAVKVASDSATSPRWTASFSDIDQALQHVFNLKNGGTRPNLVAANLSIGTATTFSDPCNVVPATNALFLQLRNINIAPVVAAGNNGSNTQMSAPGCESNALAIGATDDADVPAGFTNSSPGLEWWAPGVSIEAAVPSGNNSGFKDGTSMATPHVVGAFGLLSECVDGVGNPLTLAGKIARLNATGVDVTRNGVTRKRINVLDAATGTVNNNDFAASEVLPAAGNVNNFDFTVCSDTEPGEPATFSLDNGIWYSWTPNATGVATVSTDDGGGNVTTFDSTLAVYTGNSLGTLQLHASDDDAGVGVRSLVTMGVNAGTTYRIKVDGFGAANGLLNLHVSGITPAPCQGVNATLVGGPLADTINGTAGNDVIVSFGGDDTITGGDGNDRICSDAGADFVRAEGGDDSVFGGADADRVFGGPDDDTVLGNAGGGDNNDVGDSVHGGPGDDFVDGWVGDDVLWGDGGDDTIRGAAGTDRVVFDSSPNGVRANLNTGGATGQGTDTFNNGSGPIERLTGSDHNDVLVGDGGPNNLAGLRGNDILIGLAGNDLMKGGRRADTMLGGAGNDVVNGEPGVDTVSFAQSPNPVNVDLAAGTATGEGADMLTGVENVVGSGHGDLLAGNNGINVLRGRNGFDVLNARGGADRAFGGKGHDTMRGHGGDDRLFGEAGNDVHHGGSGTDRCSGGPGADSQTSCEFRFSIP